MIIMDKSRNYAVPITRCVPQILGCVHHRDWLNMVHNMTGLAQFSQQVKVGLHTVLFGLRMFGDLSYHIYCPRPTSSEPY